MVEKSKKYHVGKFSVTDKNSAFAVTGKVESNKEFTDGLFFLEIFPFSKNDKSISVAFNCVELRGFVEQLQELYYGTIPHFSKFSGGNSNIKSISVKIIDRDCSFDFKHNSISLFFRAPKHHLIAMAKQMEHLINQTMDAVYKTQQFRDRKQKRSGN